MAVSLRALQRFEDVSGKPSRPVCRQNPGATRFARMAAISCLLWRLRPIEMLVEEFKGADSVDGMRAIEEFDLGAIANTELVVETLHLGEFVSHPFVRSHAIIVS